MAKKHNIRDLTRYMMATRSSIVEGHARAILEMTLRAEQIAKRNVTKQFGGRSLRKLSGRLLNSIYHGFEINSGLSLPTGYIGTRGTPYGRVHELGGKITPDQAQHLWVKNSWDANAWKINKRLTPTEWISRWKKSRSTDDMNYRFGFRRDGTVWSAGVEEDDTYTPLFFLKDEVDIPARPYLTPAVTEATENYAQIVGKHIRAAIARRFTGG